jgi:hypothetical protein
MIFFDDPRWVIILCPCLGRVGVCACGVRLNLDNPSFHQPTYGYAEVEHP